MFELLCPHPDLPLHCPCLGKSAGKSHSPQPAVREISYMGCGWGVLDWGSFSWCDTGRGFFLGVAVMSATYAKTLSRTWLLL